MVCNSILRSLMRQQSSRKKKANSESHRWCVPVCDSSGRNSSQCVKHMFSVAQTGPKAPVFRSCHRAGIASPPYLVSSLCWVDGPFSSFSPVSLTLVKTGLIRLKRIESSVREFTGTNWGSMTFEILVSPSMPYWRADHISIGWKFRFRNTRIQGVRVFYHGTHLSRFSCQPFGGGLGHLSAPYYRASLITSWESARTMFTIPCLARHSERSAHATLALSSIEGRRKAHGRRPMYSDNPSSGANGPFRSASSSFFGTCRRMSYRTRIFRP